MRGTDLWKQTMGLQRSRTPRGSSECVLLQPEKFPSNGTQMAGFEDTFWSHRDGQRVGGRAVPSSSTDLSHQLGIGGVLRDAPNV